MSSHIDRTQDVTKEQEGLSQANILEISSATPTIKKLVLQVHNKSFTFKAGQWVDFHIPEVSTFSGYSMYSAPLLLEKKKLLHLAVKLSDYAPAMWVHQKCKVGDQVTLQVGGDFSYNATQENVCKHVLLIAGGVGINPMLSIFQSICDKHQDLIHLKNTFGLTQLLYSATSVDELAFKDIIDDITCKDSLLVSKCFVTKDVDKNLTNNNIFLRRINEDDIKSAFVNIDASSVITYLCGPNPMMASMKEMLMSNGVLEQNILFESWW